MIVADGFITGAAVLVAHALQPFVLQRCVFAHCSAEAGHALMLEHLGVDALLSLGLRLGEGSGAALAWPLLESACRILREMSFENNQLIEISFNHFAQADDGSVYYFGEVVNIYENGVIVNHEGSWLVGGPGVSDPPETTTATAPGLIMPGTPELGDMFKPEDLFPVVDETGTVVATGKTLRVPTGLYTDVIKIKETSQLPGGKEAKFYAPGVGELQAQARDELQRLIATTFAQP